MKSKTPRAIRPAGWPPSPDLVALSEDQVQERREIVARLEELTKRAEKGDRKVIPEIRGILDRSPDLAWRLVDLGKTAERLLIDKSIEEKDLAAREGLEHLLETMRREVAGNSVSPLERLLAERIIATWLQVQLFEALYAANLGDLTLNQANYYQKRLDRAHRRHLSAIRTLAQIRKLGPSVQINIADKQINTIG